MLENGVPQLPEQIIDLVFDHLYRDLTRPTRAQPSQPFRPSLAAPYFARFSRVSKQWNRRAMPYLARYVPVAVARDTVNLIEFHRAQRMVDWVDLTGASGDRKAPVTDWKRVLQVTLPHVRRLDLDALGGDLKPDFKVATCHDLIAALRECNTLPSLSFLYIAVSGYWPLPTISALARKAPNLVHLEVRGPPKRPSNGAKPLTFTLSALQGLETLVIATKAYNRVDVITGLLPSLVYPSASSLVSLHLYSLPAVATNPVSAISVLPVFPSLRTLTLISGFLDCCHPAFFLHLFPSLIEASIPAIQVLTPDNFPLPPPSLRFLSFNIVYKASASGLLTTLTDPSLSALFSNLLALDLLVAACEALDIRLSGAFVVAPEDAPWKYHVGEGEEPSWALGRDDVLPSQSEGDGMDVDTDDGGGGDQSEDGDGSSVSSYSSSDGQSIDSLDYDAEDDFYFVSRWSREKKERYRVKSREQMDADMAALDAANAMNAR
ncbi:hypothetical protein JCM11251_005396 [Rhodosporidiobolus azoricus]